MVERFVHFYRVKVPHISVGSFDFDLRQMFDFLQPVLSLDGCRRDVGHLFHFTCFCQQIPSDIRLEQIGLEEGVSLVNNDMGFFAGIDAQLGQYAAHLGERVVGGHDLDDGMACDIISDLIGLIALPIDAQQRVAMLMDLVLDQPNEGYCDDGVT